MRIRWSAKAERDLERILRDIHADNPSAANRLGDRIESLLARVRRHPFMHRPGRVAGTREAVIHPNYILVYVVSDGEIGVRAIIHARRRYP